jgi:dTDP-4-amino-4,6-dideoxygalactose transaminase
MEIIPYGRQHIDNSDVAEVSKALKQNIIASGPLVDRFERKIKLLTQSKFQLACNSGTSGLLMAFMSINLDKNDTVICPSINFTSTNNILKLLGSKVFLADVDPITGQMTPENLLECIKKNNIKNIKAVVTMYLGGQPLNVVRFFQLKKKFNFILIEDACHAFGAEYKYDNKFIKIGSCKHSDICVFSLHPLKTITSGEGGVLTTNNKKIYEKCKLFRSHGIARTKNHYNYNVISCGLNLRLSDINCALAISQLKKIRFFLMKRKTIYQWYSQKLRKYDKFLFLPIHGTKVISSNHLYQVNLKIKNLKICRDTLIKILLKKKIFAQIHYIPIYKHTNFLKLKKIFIKKSEQFYNTTLSLPIFYSMNEKKVNYVVKCLSNIFKQYKKS